ncbi:hypothetical protein ABZ719_21650 [Streptomyces sp. NPDC006743]|uniref:hypothetical protein n=1 Tax=Streptomyces sp. NPDC006743 TaxID=3154480 RepID=UPI003455A47A
MEKKYPKIGEDGLSEPSLFPPEVPRTDLSRKSPAVTARFFNTPSLFLAAYTALRGCGGCGEEEAVRRGSGGGGAD